MPVWNKPRLRNINITVAKNNLNITVDGEVLEIMFTGTIQVSQ